MNPCKYCQHETGHEDWCKLIAGVADHDQVISALREIITQLRAVNVNLYDLDNHLNCIRDNTR